MLPGGRELPIRRVPITYPVGSSWLTEDKLPDASCSYRILEGGYRLERLQAFMVRKIVNCRQVLNISCLQAR